MKRIWSLITVVVMAIFILPITAYATEESTEEVTPIVCGDYEYTLNENNEATITAYKGSATELEIPEKMDGYTVVEIGDNVFLSNEILEQVSMPNSIRKIGAQTFHDCSQLKNIALSGQLESIGDWAFWGCESLSEINIPESVSDMGVYVFAYCINLKSVELPEDWTTLPQGIFFGCTELTEIDIPDNVTEIGWDAFAESGLTQIVLSDNVSEMGYYVFSGCKNLRSVQLGSGVNVLENESFKDCTALEEIVLTCSIKKVNEKAFAGCTNLTKITIPQTTNKIDVSAFDEPTKITVYGVPGSYAQTWANTNGATFVEYEQHATSVSINPTKISLNNGEWINLPTVSVIPADCTDKVVWTTDNWLVASVSDELYGNGPGTTTITATVGELSASCEVTVISLGTDIIFSYQNVDAEFLGAYIYDSNGSYIEKISNNNKYDKTVTLEGISQGTYTVEIYGEDFVSRKYTIVVGETVVNQEVELHKTGDITGDDTINARDKKMLYNHIAGTAILEDYDFAVGDVTGDGTLNARDKKMIYNHIAGTSSLWE